MSYIAKQPNGLYCRFSSVVDEITDYNMNEDEYCDIVAERGKDEALRTLRYHCHDFSEIIEDYDALGKLLDDKFQKILEEVNRSAEDVVHYDRNLTAEDTLQMMADFYSDLFPTRKHALNHLFCVVGNGYEWIDGKLVDLDIGDLINRYRLINHINHAEFRSENEWNRMHKIYSDLNELNGTGVPAEYSFDWYPLSTKYSKIYTAPEDISSDWKELLDECKNMLRNDGIVI